MYISTNGGYSHNLKLLRQQSPKIMWLKLSGLPVLCNSANYRRMMNHTVTMCQRHLNTAQRHRNSLILEASPNSVVWNNPDIEALIKTRRLRKSKIRMCNYGVKSITGQPTSQSITYVHNYHKARVDEGCNCGKDANQHAGGPLQLLTYDMASVHRGFLGTLFRAEEFHQLQREEAHPRTKTYPSQTSQAIQSQTSQAIQSQTSQDDNQKKSRMENQETKIPEKTTSDNSSQKEDQRTSKNEKCKQVRFKEVDEVRTYPTEAAERAKMKHKMEQALNSDHAKAKPKKKKKIVEQHFDDCGMDTSSIDKLLPENHHNFIFDIEQDHCADDHDNYISPLFGLQGSGNPDHREYYANHKRMTDMETFIATWYYPVHSNGKRNYVDVIEFCGGLGRVSSILIRRYHNINTGLNFEIDVGFNMNDPRDVATFWRYMELMQPLIVILSPPCKGRGGWASMNRILHPDTQQRVDRITIPLCQLAGKIALHQLRHGRHFLSEHPQTTDMYKMSEWREVRNHPNMVWTTVHQCMTGLRDRNTKRLHKKPTEFWASSQILLQPLRRFTCNGRHDHEHIEGNNSADAQIWTWTLASAIASGCAKLIKQEREYRFYPTTSTETVPPTGDEPGHAPPGITCRACLNGYRRDDWRHTRDPVGCRVPEVEPRDWSKCKGCVNRKPPEHRSHTHIPGECRAGIRQEHSQRLRHGAHPRDPAVKAHGDPTTNLRPSDTREDLRIEEKDISRNVPDIICDPVTLEPWEGNQPSASSSSTPRTPTTPRTAGPRTTSSASQVYDDQLWSRFDMSRALQQLRSEHEPTIIRTLRTLHLRWWHGSALEMKRLLTAAGISSNIIEKVDQIVNTCKVCRTWHKPGERPMAQLRLTTQFNNTVQVDLLFPQGMIVLHVVDEATRWSAAKPIKSKNTKAKPSGIRYRRLKPPLALIGISDASFRAQDEDCLALRGEIIAIGEVHNGKLGGNCHVLSYLCRKQQRVTRSTFAAEIQAGLDCGSTLVMMTGLMYEIMNGPTSSGRLYEIVNGGQTKGSENPNITQPRQSQPLKDRRLPTIIISSREKLLTHLIPERNQNSDAAS